MPFLCAISVLPERGLEGGDRTLPRSVCLLVLERAEKLRTLPLRSCFFHLGDRHVGIAARQHCLALSLRRCGLRRFCLRRSSLGLRRSLLGGRLLRRAERDLHARSGRAVTVVTL